MRLSDETSANSSDRQLFAGLMAAIADRQCRDSFAQLFEYFAPRLKGYMQQLGADPGEAEELAQEVMITVWRKAGQFDPAKASVSTWIFRIARNRRIDAHRRTRLGVSAVPAPFIGGRTLGHQQHGASPLATNGEALHEAQ